MRKALLYLSILLLVHISYGHCQNNADPKPLNAVIDHQYETYQSPVEVRYTIFPYGGSGSYEFRWRLKGDEYGDFSDATQFQFTFVCSLDKRPENIVFCQVRDKVTGNTYTAKKIHAIEFCIN